LTEQEWLACDDPHEKLWFLETTAGERKLRLWRSGPSVPWPGATGRGPFSRCWPASGGRRPTAAPWRPAVTRGKNEAERALAILGRGAGDAPLTHEARAALGRLNRRAAR
jgi:hypothetical protein